MAVLNEAKWYTGLADLPDAVNGSPLPRSARWVDGVAYMFDIAAGSITFSLEAGHYTETGAALAFAIDTPLALGAGAYALSGADLTFFIRMYLGLDPGAFALTGADFTFIVYDGTFSLGAGAWVVTGADFTFTVTNAYFFDLSGPGHFIISPGGDMYFPQPGASKVCYIFRKRRDHFRI